MNGGLPGQRSEKIIERANGKVEKLPSKCDRIVVEAGDLLYFNTWGGGGCGDPLKRPAERVAFDTKAGLVTRKGARRYGVVLNPDLSVNEKQTTALRKKMAKSRGKPKMFDFGGKIKDLKKNCKRETGHPAPKQPEFQTWFLEKPKKAKSSAKKKSDAKPKKAAKARKVSNGRKRSSSRKAA